MGTSCNNLLHEYGIQNEQSDLRAHVCPLVRRVYVYPTVEGQRAIKGGRWPARKAYQPGVVGETALGYCVPPFVIRRCVALEVRAEAWGAAHFDQNENTSEKGNKAVQFVAGMIRAGIFPLPCLLKDLVEEADKAIQIKGDDITVTVGSSRIHVQVKCDYRGGDPTLGGTGNLYLQVAERNPLKRV